MKMVRSLELIVVGLLLAGMANAQQVVTVQDTMDYRDNLWDEEAGVWFMIPDDIEDHSPWYRTSNQDWGWMHNVASLVPSGATGIESATLTINAWDVNPTEGEDDVIYMNAQKVGLLTGVYRDWQLCTFNVPAAQLNDLWRDKRLYIYMDIDQIVDLSGGFRVTLGYSTLSVKYRVSGGGTPTTPDKVPVYRFWSPVFSGHFYTTDSAERDWLIATYPTQWTYETIAYRALSSKGNTNAKPVYRFWSDQHSSHFYTIDEAEKQSVIANYPGIWTYETVAFYAFAPGTQPAGTLPVYRFWSPVYGHHFYTINESDKQMLIRDYPNFWTYETIAWYAYVP